MSSPAGRRTWAEAKLYARDRLQDVTSTKGVREAERVVLRALKRIARARFWAWYRRKTRVIVRAPVAYTTVNAGALAVSVVNSSAKGFSTLLRGASLRLSAKTELMRVRSVVGSSLALLWATEPFVGLSVGATFRGGGTFVYERIALPRNFRSLPTQPHQSNYLSGLHRIGLDDMNRLKRTWDNAESEPIYYTIALNEQAIGGPQYELWIWPPPSTIKTIDFLADYWPEEPSADADFVDWDPNQDDLLDRAMDVEAAVELESDKKYARAESAFRTTLRAAKAGERLDTTSGPAGSHPYMGSKQYRSDHFTDVP